MAGKRRKLFTLARHSKAAAILRRSSSAVGLPVPFSYPKLSLLGLPAELRNLLYEYVFHPPDTEDYLRALQTDPHFGNGLTFLRTCRLVYHEARYYAYASLTPLLSPFSKTYVLELDNLQTSGKGKIKPPLDLVKRITIQHFLFFAVYPWWQMAGIEPEELVIQLCICSKLHDLHSRPKKCDEVCDTIESAAIGVRSLRRIVVYYCGPEWPRWICMGSDVHFPSIVAGCRSKNGVKLEVIRDEAMHGESEEDERMSETLQQNGVGVGARHFRLTGDYFNKHSDREVYVDFINSIDICGRECIRDRNPGPSHDPDRPAALIKLEKSK